MNRLIALILRATAIGMGLSVVVLAQLRSVTGRTALTMLGIGLTCLAITSLDAFNRKR